MCIQVDVQRFKTHSIHFLEAICIYQPTDWNFYIWNFIDVKACLTYRMHGNRVMMNKLCFQMKISETSTGALRLRVGIENTQISFVLPCSRKGSLMAHTFLPRWNLKSKQHWMESCVCCTSLPDDMMCEIILLAFVCRCWYWKLANGTILIWANKSWSYLKLHVNQLELRAISRILVADNLKFTNRVILWWQQNYWLT